MMNFWVRNDFNIPAGANPTKITNGHGEIVGYTTNVTKDSIYMVLKEDILFNNTILSNSISIDEMR